jgi:hypothetical protein
MGIHYEALQLMGEYYNTDFSPYVSMQHARQYESYLSALDTRLVEAARLLDIIAVTLSPN